jgi:hypothetical protein
MAIGELRHPSFLHIPLDKTVEEAEFIGNWYTPYKVHPNCPDDGGVCICSNDAVFSTTPSVTCGSWTFQVGDLMMYAAPTVQVWFLKYVGAYASALYQRSPIIHTGIITSVPPLGTRQTPYNIIISESLDPQGISKCTLFYAVGRYPWGGFAFRRVDPARFPTFHTTARLQAMQQFATGQYGHVFDSEMINPLTNKYEWSTHGRYIQDPPSCQEKTRAWNMYQQGGLSNWMCSQFVTWSWAFAGGLNTDYGMDPACPGLPKWNIKNMEPFPGDLWRDTTLYEPSSLSWFKGCPSAGCFVAMPVSWPHGEMVIDDGSSPAIDPGQSPAEFPAVGL